MLEPAALAAMGQAQLDAQFAAQPPAGDVGEDVGDIALPVIGSARAYGSAEPLLLLVAENPSERSHPPCFVRALEAKLQEA